MSGASEPFPRSTVLLGNQKGKLRMYLVDRNFTFTSYNFEGYLDKKISDGRFYNLDQSIVNSTCSDLKHVQMNDNENFLILLCLSIEPPLIDRTKNRKNYITIVQIRDYYENDPYALYYTMDYENAKIDHQYTFRFVANFSDMHTSERLNGSFGLFMA